MFGYDLTIGISVLTDSCYERYYSTPTEGEFQ